MDTIPDWLDFISPFLRGLLTATGIGLIIGLEREHTAQAKEHPLAGLRTFPLLSILGFTAGYLGKNFLPMLLPAALAGLFALIAVAYFMQAREKNFGLTTEFALITVFMLGVLPAYDHNLDALAGAVVVTILLSLKEELHGFVAKITEAELAAFVKFIVLAILLLPVLPDQNFGPEDQLNYRDLGWIIVLVSGISFTGYLLLKFAGLRHGILLTALVGGLFSSTMIAWVFAARSRETPPMSRILGAGIVLASTVMPARVLFFTGLFNRPLMMQMLLPCGLMLVVSLLIVWYLLHTEKRKPGKVEDFPLGNPLDIKNALFFAGLYIGISLLMFYSQQWFGAAGAYITALISGVADMDAIAISTAKRGQAGESLALGANVIVVAMLSNTVFKAIVASSRGDASIRPAVLMGFGAVLAVGAVWLAVRLI